MKAAASPGRASREQLSSMPISQRSQMRRRSSGRPGGSSAGCPQLEQKRIGLGRSPPLGTNERSIRMRAVTRGDENTEVNELVQAISDCTGSGLHSVRKREMRGAKPREKPPL